MAGLTSHSLYKISEMKKAILIVAFLSASIFSFAQGRIGIHGNIIAANMNESFDGEEEFNGKNLISYKFGITSNFQLSENLSIMPQLNYLVKGTRINESGSYDFFGMNVTYSAKGKIKLNYLELPIHLVYNKTLTNGNRFFIGAGPSFSYGLSGKGNVHVVEVVNGTRNEETQNATVKFDGKENGNDDYQHYKAMEVGLSILTGYHFTSKFFIAANINQGISNINTDGADGGKTKTWYVGLGLGFYFGK
jgi:hypothetical protein